jgi:hypothetical protein
MDFFDTILDLIGVLALLTAGIGVTAIIIGPQYQWVTELSVEVMRYLLLSGVLVLSGMALKLFVYDRYSRS